MKVRDEIHLHAADADKPTLEWLFDRYHWASQWSFVAKCTFVKYGTQSYQANRVWTPTEEGHILYKHMSGDKCSECGGAGEVETGVGMMVCDKCKGDGTP